MTATTMHGAAVGFVGRCHVIPSLRVRKRPAREQQVTCWIETCAENNRGADASSDPGWRGLSPVSKPLCRNVAVRKQL